MVILTKEDKIRIKSLVKSFTDKSLGSNSPSGMCFLTCYPLSIFLTIKGIKNSIKIGSYETITNGSFHHSWINLEDEDDTSKDCPLPAPHWES